MTEGWSLTRTSTQWPPILFLLGTGLVGAVLSLASLANSALALTQWQRFKWVLVGVVSVRLLLLGLSNLSSRFGSSWTLTSNEFICHRRRGTQTLVFTDITKITYNMSFINRDTKPMLRVWVGRSLFTIGSPGSWGPGEWWAIVTAIAPASERVTDVDGPARKLFRSVPR